MPFPIESALSGITRSALYMWYRRTVQIPSEWQGRRIHLNFGAVNWQAIVWINGQHVGEHHGAYDSFSFDITEALHEGDNEVIVGVYSPLESGGIPLGKQRRATHDIFYTASSGIWQTVWLEPTHGVHIVKLETTPDVAGGKLDLIVRAAGTSTQGLHVVVSGGGEHVASVDGFVGEIIYVPISGARLWSPEDPFLYDLRVTLTGPGGGDTVGGYFGMRSISTGFVDGFLRPLLNGEFVFQLGTLDQGFWPDGLYTAPTDDALKFDLQQHKNLGFNTVRKHIKVEPARWYYWADTLGLLVWQDMPAMPVSPPNPGVAPPVGDRPNFEDELHRIIDQLRGFTSIVQWQPFNESWAAYDRARIAALVKSWDPTRLVDIDSGGILLLPNSSDHIDDPPKDGDWPIVGDCIDDHVYPGPENGPYLPRSSSTTRVAVVGEFGASGLVVVGHEWHPGGGFTLPGCPLFADSAALTEWYVERMDLARDAILTRGLSAAIYTQLTDVEDERNGLWTYDRQVLKVDAEQVMRANLNARTAAAKDRTQQHIFYRGASDGAVNHMFWDAAMRGLYFDEWTTKADAPSAVGKPSTMVWPNQQHIFYRGDAGAINHIFWDVPTSRLCSDQWQPNAQVPRALPAAGDPATMVWPNQQHIFYRGNDGTINHIFWDVPTSRLYCDQWQPNAQIPHAPPAAGEPATMVTSNQQHVFYRGLDGAINHIFWDAPSNRLYFDQWTTRVQAPFAVGDPATMFTQ